MKQKVKFQLGLITCLLLLMALSPLVSIRATDYSSTSYKVKDPVIDEGASSSSSTNFGLGQSLSQTAIGKSTSSSFQLWSGFQYFFKVSANTLTATAGNGQVSLSWTVPATNLGATVGSYEVGTGTVSGSYTFENVGNVVSYTKTGLTNGTTYYFKIKAKTAGGTFLVFSNEANATPTAPASPPPPSGGGGGGGGGGAPVSSYATIVLKGLASPGATVFVLKDGSVAASVTADPGAAFNVTVSNLNTGIYSFSLYAEDTKGVKTPTHSFIQALTVGITTTVDNIFLGPTIGLSHSIIKQGDTMNFFGFTAPASAVSLFVNSHQRFIEKVVAENSGAWFKAFNTLVLELGSHTGKSQSVKGNLLSPYSHTVEFQVGDRSVEAPSGGECRRSDLNCDGRVNLTDFSILLFFWNQTNPSNARADINKSGSVDLVDFSIMLFDWTG